MMMVMVATKHHRLSTQTTLRGLTLDADKDMSGRVAVASVVGCQVLQFCPTTTKFLMISRSTLLCSHKGKGQTLTLIIT